MQSPGFPGLFFALLKSKWGEEAMPLAADGKSATIV